MSIRDRYILPSIAFISERMFLLALFTMIGYILIGSSANTPAPSTRNCAVDYRIAASIGVTDVRVQ